MYIISFFDLKEEKDELLKTFKKLDLDHDGQLTPDELIIGYTAMMGEEDAKKEVDRIFKSIDVNHTGAIDFTGRPKTYRRIFIGDRESQEATVERATCPGVQDVRQG